MFLSRNCLFDRIVDDEVEEKVIASKSSTNFSATLKVNEELFVHELSILNMIRDLISKLAGY